MATPRVTEATLKEALLEYEFSRFDQFPSTEESKAQYEQSPEKEAQMKRLFRLYQKPYARFINTIGKRVAVIFVATLLSMTIAITSVKAWREPVWSFIVKVYDEFSSIFVGEDSDKSEVNGFPRSIETIYEATYIPAEYARKDFQNDHFKVVYQYERGPQEYFTLAQLTLDSSEYMMINTEGVETSIVTVADSEGLYYSNLGVQNLIWRNDEYGFILSGTIDVDEFIRIANSVTENIAEE